MENNALVLTNKNEVKVQVLAMPQPKADEVVLEIAYAGICGTDKHLFAGLPGSADVTYPRVLGHENSGTVVAIGENVQKLAVGDRVAIDPNIYCGDCDYCRAQEPELCENLSAVGVTRDGGFENYTTAPAKVVYKIADNVSLKAAAMTEPLSCVVHGIDLLTLKPHQKAIVLGDGFIGQMFIQALKAYGVHHVAVSSRKVSDAQHVELLKSMGADAVVDGNAKEFAENYHIVIEAVGSSFTQEQAVANAEKGGQVLMFGVGNPDQTFTISSYAVFAKQLKIQGSFINPYSFQDSLALLASGKIDVERLISHELSFAQVPAYLANKFDESVNKAVINLQKING